MIDRVARASERSQDLLRAPLKLHVGINTGPVVAGGIGAGSARSYSVSGDTVRFLCVPGIYGSLSTISDFSGSDHHTRYGDEIEVATVSLEISRCTLKLHC